MAEAAKMQVSDEIAIQITGMNKWYGSFHVLRDINLTVNRGERIVICGPSGSGKSTLIRCINALEEHQKGQIVVDGTELSSDLKNIDKIRSEVGMVFQHFKKLHAGPDLGAQNAQGRGRRDCDAFSGKGENPGAGVEIPRPAFGRPATARCYCPFALHAPAHHAL